MKKVWETGLLLFAMWGFWGMIYPDLCFTEDICARVVHEEAAACEMPEKESKKDSEKNSERNSKEGSLTCVVCRGQAKAETAAGIYSVEPGQIRIKSRLLEFLKKNVSEGEERGKGKSDVRDRKNRSLERSSGRGI